MKPQTTYYLMRSGVSFFYSMWLTVTLLYHTTAVTTDPLLLVLLGVVLEGTTFIFEVPTGVVADSYGRKRSIVIGLILMGAAYLLEGSFAIYLTVLLAQFLYGLGFTFYSGANDAWLADEIGPSAAASVFMRGTQLSQLSTQIGILSAIVVGQGGLQWPLVVAGVGMMVVGLLLSALMSETGFHPPHTPQPVFQQLSQTFQHSLQLLRVSPRFVTVVLVGFVVGLSLGGYDRLFTPHFLLNFDPPLEPVVWFGLLSAVVSLSSAVMLEWIRRRARLLSAESVPRLIAVLYGGTILGNLVFVFAGQFGLAVMAYWFSQMLRATTRPLIIIWINQITESRVRATAISMYWQLNALGHIVGLPIIGWIGRIASLQTALLSAVLALAPTLWLLLRKFVHAVRSEDDA